MREKFNTYFSAAPDGEDSSSDSSTIKDTTPQASTSQLPTIEDSGATSPIISSPGSPAEEESEAISKIWSEGKGKNPEKPNLSINTCGPAPMEEARQLMEETDKLQSQAPTSASKARKIKPKQL